MKLVLQPCGAPDAQRHFDATIQHLVPVARIIPFLSPPDAAYFAKAFGDAVAVWGVTPAKNGSNAHQWKQMEQGDLVLLSRSREFFFKGTVAFKTHNRPLAEELWGFNSKGETWEHVFFLTGLEPINLPLERYIEASGDAPDYVVQRFRVLSDEKSAKTIDALDLATPSGAAVVTDAEVTRARKNLAALQGTLDLPSEGSRREEQRLLRTIFLRNKAKEKCAFCGNYRPVDLIVVGHIKRRSSCRPEERKSEENLVLSCLVGCDSLFEKGYIVVDEKGAIRTFPTPAMDEDLRSSLKAMEGNSCYAWNERSAGFFFWHRLNRPRFV